MPLLDNTKQARENLLRELSTLSDMTPEKIDPILKRTEEAFGIEFKKKVVWMVVALFAFSLGFLWLGLWWIATEEYSLLHSKPPVVKSPIITNAYS